MASVRKFASWSKGSQTKLRSLPRRCTGRGKRVRRRRHRKGDRAAAGGNQPDGDSAEGISRRRRLRVSGSSGDTDDVPEFYCRAWSCFRRRWIAYVDCDQDYKDKIELLGQVSINGKVYRCTGVLISVMNHRTGQLTPCWWWLGRRQPPSCATRSLAAPTTTPPASACGSHGEISISCQGATMQGLAGLRQYSR
jgi:hypothetical protein